MEPLQLQQLAQWSQSALYKDKVMTIEQIHGFLCAIISNPSLIPMTTWLPALYGYDKGLLAQSTVAEINPLITQLYEELVHSFATESEINPLFFTQDKIIDRDAASNEQIASWCAGYMAGVSANKQTWLSSGHSDIYNLLTPIGAFAQFFEDEQTKAGSEIDPQAIRQQYLPLLPATISNIYHFWRQHQHCNHGHHHHGIETLRHTDSKVGRNDPCVCGSGKKFKKCCGA